MYLLNTISSDLHREDVCLMDSRVNILMGDKNCIIKTMEWILNVYVTIIIIYWVDIAHIGFLF